MIKLFGFGPQFGLADPSPFVLKVDAYLRMSGIEFESVRGIKYLQNAPKRKLPYIEDNGHIVADSYFIISYLRQKYNISIDQWLSEEQEATMNLIIKSLDENFYWCIVYSRWIMEDTWPVIKQAFFSEMPFPIKYIAPIVARNGVKSTMIKHGIGRHSDEEIKTIAKNTLESLSTLLGNKPYFFGDKPSTLDATAYAFLSELILVNFNNSMNELARSFDNLANHCQHIHQKYYY